MSPFETFAFLTISALILGVWFGARKPLECRHCKTHNCGRLLSSVGRRDIFL